MSEVYLPESVQRSFILSQMHFLDYLRIWYVPLAGQHVKDKTETEESEGILKDLIDKVSSIDAEVQLLEGEYKKDLLDHDKVCFFPKYRIIFTCTIFNWLSTDLQTSFHYPIHKTTLMKNWVVNHVILEWLMTCSVYYFTKIRW